MDLSQFIDKNETKEPIEVQYPGTEFYIKLKPVTKIVMNKFVESSKRTEWDPHTHQRTVVTNEEKLNSMLNDYAIISWRGLTPAVIAQFIPMQSLEGVAPDYEFPCTPETKRVLMDRSGPLSTFVTNVVLDVNRFSEKALEEESKNSNASPGGGSAAAQ